MSKDLDKFLNIASGENLPAVYEKRTNTQVDTDFEFARENIMDVVNKGQEALFDLMDVARQSQHPRAYEVLATMMNTMVGASKDLLDLQAKKKKMLEDDPNASAQQVTNNLFVGSTAELQKYLKQQKSEDSDE
jgi:hypothetical protein